MQASVHAHQVLQHAAWWVDVCAIRVCRDCASALSALIICTRGWGLFLGGWGEGGFKVSAAECVALQAPFYQPL